MDDQTWPLCWDDWDGPVGLHNIAHRGLGSRREIGDEQGDCRERSPGAGVFIAVDVGVDGGGIMEGIVWVGEIMYSSEFAWL